MAGKKNGKRTAEQAQPEPSEDQIRIRAYEIYIARNGGPGNEIEDWLQAEKELSVATTIAVGD